MGLFFNKWLLILLLGLVAVVFVIILRLLNKKHIRNPIESHSVLTDKDFLEALKVAPEQKALAVATRNAVAAVTKVPPETLHPSDTMTHIKSLGFDFSSFIIELESFASINVDYEAFWAATVSNKDFVEPTTLGDLTRYFLSNLESIAISLDVNKESKGN
ncbi:MAG: hypothetical protein ACYST6_13820 [Planctomycetota bacterium]|jgi:hypothetical protein